MTAKRIPVAYDQLNIGCGDNFHPEWCNVDIHPVDPRVIEFDVRFGLPFADNSFSAVYHSHVLEHVSCEAGEGLMHECFRVLRPGGVLRVVVPDLETIASLYLEKLRRADPHNQSSVADYLWMKLELLDQLVRDQSGGLMGRYMADPHIVNSEFVRSRIGNEFWRCRPREKRTGELTIPAPATRDRARSWRQRIDTLREKLARSSVRVFLGRSGERALMSGLFRDHGEIHRWMHDRFSLSHLCERLGFQDFRICGPETSSIPDFARYQLDALDGAVRKPDSLFVECRKPSVAAQAA